MDKHLNLFRFFNGDNDEFLENNLSRAFALCLKNDATLLSQVLEYILGNDVYKETFNSESIDSHIEIDLQQKVNNLENFNHIYAIACSKREITKEEYQNAKARNTDEPITDMVICVNDTCIIFEFKRTEKDCSSQLKEQAELIKTNSPDCDEIKYKDFNWKEIIKVCLSAQLFESQVKNENIFLNDFIEIVKYYMPKVFPEKKLKQIPFPRSSKEDPNAYLLKQRLRSISDYVYGADQTKKIGDRYVISIDKDWAHELRLWYDSKKYKDYIFVKIDLTDTKAMGRSYFEKKRDYYDWTQKKICGYEVVANPYLKFSHFNKGIMWIDDLTEEERKKTHNYKFYTEFSGRYNKGDWENFSKKLEKVIPNWEKKTDWDSIIENSNRTYFDLSVGTSLNILIPYKEAQELDDVNNKNNKLAEKVKQIFDEIAKEIDEK